MTDLIWVLVWAYITYHFAAIVRHATAIVRLVARGRDGKARPARTLSDCVEVRR